MTHPVYAPDPARGGRLARTGYYMSARPFDRSPDTGGRRARSAVGYVRVTRAGDFELTGPCGFRLRLEAVPSLTTRGASGYYTDPDCTGTMRPIVARLPHGRGFLAGARADGNAGDLFTLDTAATIADERDAWRAAHQLADACAERARAQYDRMHCPGCHASGRAGLVRGTGAHVECWTECHDCEGAGTLARWELEELTGRAA